MRFTRSVLVLACLVGCFSYTVLRSSEPALEGARKQLAFHEKSLTSRLESWGLSEDRITRFIASAPHLSAEAVRHQLSEDSSRGFSRISAVALQEFLDTLAQYQELQRALDSQQEPEALGLGATSDVDLMAHPGDGGSTTNPPAVHVTPEQIEAALFSPTEGESCSPYLTGIVIGPHDPRQIEIKTSYGAADFPTSGADFLVLSSGDPDAPAEQQDVDFAPGGCPGDNVQITFTFDFPDAGGGVSAVQSLAFNFDFFSYEFPEFVGAGFNDYAFAYLDSGPIVVDAFCNAPVMPPAGCLITRDQFGSPTNVDNAFFEGCSTIICDDPPGVPGWHTVNNGTPGDDAGRTGTLTTCSPTGCAVPMKPGVHTLTLIVGDAGDGLWTSAGLFDNLRCFSDLECSGPTTGHCGDNVTDPGEDCDDGNQTSGDGCSATCTLEGEGECGNDVIDLGEECDDGNTTSGDGCSADCTIEPAGECGDDVLDDGEECDDGNTTSGDGCSADCTIEPAGECGDDVLDDGEECDDGNTTSGDGCSADCTIEPAGECGDDVLDDGEECDDGNTTSGDGCSADCTIEVVDDEGDDESSDGEDGDDESSDPHVTELGSPAAQGSSSTLELGHNTVPQHRGL